MALEVVQVEDQTQVRRLLVGRVPEVVVVELLALGNSQVGDNHILEAAVGLLLQASPEAVVVRLQDP